MPTCTSTGSKMKRTILLTLITAIAGYGQLFTEDFESYAVGNTLCAADDWGDNSSFGSCSVFEITDDAGNMVVRAATSGSNAATAEMPPLSGMVDLTWRWLAEGASVNVGFGPVTPDASNPGNWSDYRARLVLEADQWNAKGSAWADRSGWPSVTEGQWYYMRMRLDFDENTYSAWVASSPDRSDEYELVSGESMAGTGDCSHVMMKANSGTGHVLVDDIVLEQISTPSEDYGDWQYSTDIFFNTTSQGAGVAGDVSDFPVLIRLNEDNFAFADAQATGADLRFADSLGTPLSCEVAQWDSESRTAAVWVLVPSVPGDHDGFSIQMYWGNAQASDQSNSESVFAADNGFAGVWHLDESVTDATGTGGDAVLEGGMSLSANSVAGAAGVGLSLDGTDDYLDLGYNAAFDVAGNAAGFALSAWINVSTSQAGDGGIVGRWGGNGEHQYVLKYESDEEQIKFALYDGDYVVATSTAGSITLGDWHYIVGTVTGNTLELFIDGQSAATMTGLGTIDDIGAEFSLLVGREGSNPANYLAGMVDEVAIHLAERSPDWIKLAYENQKENQTLLTFGTIGDNVAAPTGLQAAVDNAGIHLTWGDNAQNETGYEVLYGETEAELQVLASLPANAQSYTHAVTACGLGYYYAVRAYNDVNVSSLNSLASPAYTTPCVPTSVTATAQSASRIDVAWNGTAPEFVLTARLNAEPWEEIYRGSGTSFAHQPLECSSYWEYRVQALVPDGRSSDYSETADATTNYCDIDNPSDLVADSTVPGRITLSWTNNSDRAIGFRVYRKDSDAGFIEIEDYVQAETPSYVDRNVLCETEYSYYVTAYDVYAESGPSNTVTTHTLFCGAGLQTAGMITLQGLYTENGSPFTGMKPLATVKLYTSENADAPVYEETFRDVSVRNGWFKLPVGISNNVVTVIRSTDYLYYDILIDGASVFDNGYQPLTASPYSIKSSYAMSGEGSPIASGVSAPVGATYVDTEGKVLYIKYGVGDGDWRLVGE